MKTNQAGFIKSSPIGGDILVNLPLWRGTKGEISPLDRGDCECSLFLNQRDR